MDQFIKRYVETENTILSLYKGIRSDVQQEQELMDSFGNMQVAQDPVDALIDALAHVALEQ